jgi:hypothetical protein
MGDLERDLKRALRDAKCVFVRAGKGDHEIWWSPISKQNFVVDFGISSRHTANAIMKQAGLPKKF